MLTDAELLHRYIEERAEDAFAELVRRHLNLVYAAALRRTNGRHALAEDIAQKVFSDLARKATQLANHPTLTGWLYRSTRYVAIDAMRIEQRREKLAQTFTTMPEQTTPADSTPADWDQLRPVIDEAMDQLKEQDREVMLLRFFQGLTFAEVGAKLDLTENAARMRTERALEKLRLHLGKRGITSTAALAGLLASESLVAAPASLAGSVTTAAMAAAPAGALATFVTKLLMNKIAIASLSVVCAAGITSVAWATLADNVSDNELAALRAENARLKLATAPGASAGSAAAVADEFDTQANTIVQTAGKRLGERNAAGTGKYRNCGQATPKDAVRTLAWAYDSSDVATLTKLFIYDDEGLETIRAIHASMPEAIRLQYRTPEELIAFLYAAQVVFNPLPGEDVWEKKVTDAVMTEPSAGRVLLRDPGQKYGGLNYVQTAEGWKLELDSPMLKKLVARVLSNEMLAKLAVH